MKKILLAVTLIMMYNISMACTTTMVTVNGKTTICTVCPNVVTCS